MVGSAAFFSLCSWYALAHVQWKYTARWVNYKACLEKRIFKKEKTPQTNRWRVASSSQREQLARAQQKKLGASTTSFLCYIISKAKELLAFKERRSWKAKVTFLTGTLLFVAWITVTPVMWQRCCSCPRVSTGVFLMPWTVRSKARQIQGSQLDNRKALCCGIMAELSGRREMYTEIQSQRDKIVSHCAEERRSGEEVKLVMFSTDHGFLAEFDCSKILTNYPGLLYGIELALYLVFQRKHLHLQIFDFSVGVYKVVVDIKSPLESELRFKYVFPIGVRDLFHWRAGRSKLFSEQEQF